jgi:ferrous iron transport protein B
MTEIALIGSPNCGKTTLFNRLTGARQRTGNWPGVTVEQKLGSFPLGRDKITAVDLPGVYSLDASESALDAQVARNYLHSRKASLLIWVVDATQLARHLRLLPQLQQLETPMVLVVNMIDCARKEGIEVDLELLAQKTQLPVVAISAATGEGLAALSTTLATSLTTAKRNSTASPSAQHQSPGSLSHDLGSLSHNLESLSQLAAEVSQHRHHKSLSEGIDHWLLHPRLAFPIFLMVMYLLFSISVNVGAVFIDFFDIWMGSWVVEGSRWLLTGLGSPTWLTAILADGLGGGLQLISTFIPVIGCLYFCMSILEDSGYLSRATFVIDGLMSRIGLPGQAFIPLIVGFGCNVPSVMAARALDRPSARMTTIFIAPFMSCGARLSVYVFVGTALFPEQAHNAIFLLYLLGIGVAVFSAWLLRKSLFGEDSDGSICEMPAYHRPLLRNVLIQSWQRLYAFMFRAGKRILAVVMLLSVVSSLGTDGSWGNQDSEKSVLAATGKLLTPLFVPIGIGEDNWPATVGLFSGLFAKEVVVGTLDTLYSPAPEVGNADQPLARPEFMADLALALHSIEENFSALLSSSTQLPGAELDFSNSQTAAVEQGVQHSSYDVMNAYFPSAWAAFCFLVFILLYAPCVATIGVMQKEAGSAWLQFSVAWSLLLSYWLASNLWHLSLLFESPWSSLGWMFGSTAVLVLSYRAISHRVKRHYANEIPALNIL